MCCLIMCIQETHRNVVESCPLLAKEHQRSACHSVAWWKGDLWEELRDRAWQVRALLPEGTKEHKTTDIHTVAPPYLQHSICRPL